MRISDQIRFALKNLKGRWAVLPVIGFAIAAFCLCFAGAILTTMQDEKAQPYELVISGEEANSISDSDVIEITKLEDVTAATPVMQIPASISTGDYTAALTLTGIEASYLENSFSQGNAFPEDSVMPYIVLNEAALKQFSDSETSKDKDSTGDMGDEEGTGNTARTDTEAPDVDWLNGSYSVQTGEGSKTVTSKVCGILSEGEDTEEEQEPAAYISISTAKELLRQNGQETNYTGANVRVKNIGSADSVSKSIAALGLTVTNSTEELQSGWDADNKEMTYLIVIGVFGLVCASVLLAAWRQNTLLKQKRAWEALIYIGLKASDMRNLFAIQTILLSLFGIALGLIVALTLPSFLSTGEIEPTNFMLTIPFVSVVISVIICIAAGLIPILGMSKRITE
jgi:ABC-type antimicrobial peptide transport system permease subunit